MKCFEMLIYLGSPTEMCRLCRLLHLIHGGKALGVKAGEVLTILN